MTVIPYCGQEVDVPGGEFFWCLRHDRVEEGEQACEADQRMGPYASRDEAAAWREKKDARNEKWDREDREWEDGE